MKNLTCVWRNIYNTARPTHSRYYKHFAKHACDFSLILLEPCNFLYKSHHFECDYTLIALCREIQSYERAKWIQPTSVSLRTQKTQDK